MAGTEASRPIRVVAFGGGPVLQPDFRAFLARLADEPRIDLLAAICQSGARNFRGVVRDLWSRRGPLAVPLLALSALRAAARRLSHPVAERRIDRRIAGLSDRIWFVPDVHAEEVLARVRSLAPDLGLIYGAPILKPELFEIPRLGTLGIHHGTVPAYRGKKTTFWAMYRGESTAGVTIQRVNPGLDTGEIVEQGEVPIGRRSQGAVWRDVERLGYDLYLRAILALRDGTASVRPQAGKRGKLYRDPKPKHLLKFAWRQLKRRGLPW